MSCSRSASPCREVPLLPSPGDQKPGLSGCQFCAAHRQYRMELAAIRLQPPEPGRAAEMRPRDIGSLVVLQRRDMRIVHCDVAEIPVQSAAFLRGRGQRILEQQFHRLPRQAAGLLRQCPKPQIVLDADRVCGRAASAGNSPCSELPRRAGWFRPPRSSTSPGRTAADNRHDRPTARRDRPRNGCAASGSRTRPARPTPLPPRPRPANNDTAPSCGRDTSGCRAAACRACRSPSRPAEHQASRVARPCVRGRTRRARGHCWSRWRACPVCGRRPSHPAPRTPHAARRPVLHPRRSRVRPVQNRPAQQMRRVRDAGAVVPLSVQKVAALHWLQRAHGRRAVRRDEVPVGTEQLALRLFRPVRSDDIGVRPTKRKAPAGGGMTAGNLDDQAVVGPEVELVPAKQPRLRHTVEAGLQEGLVHLRRVGAAFVGLVLLFAQPPAQRSSAFEQPIGGHVGFGSRNRVAHRSGWHCYIHARHSRIRWVNVRSVRRSRNRGEFIHRLSPGGIR